MHKLHDLQYPAEPRAFVALVLAVLEGESTEDWFVRITLEMKLGTTPSMA